MTAGETVLFIPGLGNDARLYEHQLTHLGEVGEPRFAGVPEADSMAGMAEAILAAAPPRFALVGLSMGGYVAFEIMRRAGERVTKLALLDTKAELDPPDAVEGRRAALADIEAGRYAEHIESRLPLLLGPEAFADPTLREAVRAMALTVGPARYAAQQRAIMDRPDSTGDLAGITCATLVLCGRDDALTPLDKHAAMADAIPRARLAVVEASGHLSAIEQPQAVTALLRDWLAYDR
jgi:pimeloyl-ACP methyl ester carboxylesterase